MNSPADIEALAEKAAERAIIRFFEVLGIDASKPLEMQKDFAHLRAWRLAIIDVRSKSLLAAVGIVVSGLAAAVWAALTHKF